MHILWPNHRASIIFIGVDEQGESLNISFNANKDDQPTLRHYVMSLSDVKFGKLDSPDTWKTIPVKGTCEIFLQDDQGRMVDHITCNGRAPRNLASFEFSTGSGAAHNSKLNETQ